jgi:serine/threonine-protein kinase RsbW
VEHFLADHQSPTVVTEQLASSLESVDHAEDVVMRAAREIGFDDDQQHEIGISLRECMVNAVVHGNRYNGRKKVHFAMTQTPERLEIVVGDEGDGFEKDGLPDPLAEENLMRQSGRGVLMMQAFMDEFEVSRRNPAGTEVRMVKYKNRQ